MDGGRGAAGYRARGRSVSPHVQEERQMGRAGQGALTVQVWTLGTESDSRGKAMPLCPARPVATPLSSPPPPHSLGAQVTGGPQAHFPTPSAYKHPPCPWVPPSRGPRKPSLMSSSAGVSQLVHTPAQDTWALTPECARPPCLSSPGHTVSVVLSTQQPVSRRPTM